MSHAQEHESVFWGDCCNTWGEELKHPYYAERLGFVPTPVFMSKTEPGAEKGNHWPSWELHGRSVVDIGGGPVSMLLKCQNGGEMTVVDPLPYPEWVRMRYECHGVELLQQRGEDFARTRYDEAWIYNVLQHTDDPEKVIANAWRAARVLRLFEWIDTSTDNMHPWSLTEADLVKWIGAPGNIEDGINRIWGEQYDERAFYGVWRK